MNWRESENNEEYIRGLCQKLEKEITIYFKFARKNSALMLIDEDPEIRELGRRVALWDGASFKDEKDLLDYRSMLRDPI